MCLLQANFYNQQRIMDADQTAFFFFFFSGMYLWECIVPNVDIRRQFWARSTASFNVRLWVLKSHWTVFNHVMWCHDALPVSSSFQMGEPLGSSWHLRRHQCMQYAPTKKDAVTGLSLWGLVAWSSSSPHHCAQIGAIWVKAVFSSTQILGFLTSQCNLTTNVALELQ